MSHKKRHAVLTCGFVQRFDKHAMLRTLARLRGSALRGRALGRAIVILAVLMTVSFAGSEKIDSAKAATYKPVTNLDLKDYLSKIVDNKRQYDCAERLAQHESGWRYWAKNKESGAYGLFQSMSDYAPYWDPYTQIDKAQIYIEARYDGSWCEALRHLERNGWH